MIKQEYQIYFNLFDLKKNLDNFVSCYIFYLLRKGLKSSESGFEVNFIYRQNLHCHVLFVKNMWLDELKKYTKKLNIKKTSYIRKKWPENTL